jgi:hypothetical protein
MEGFGDASTATDAASSPVADATWAQTWFVIGEKDGRTFDVRRGKLGGKSSRQKNSGEPNRHCVSNQTP